MADFALGYWSLYDKDGNKSTLTLPNPPDANGYFVGSLGNGSIGGLWNRQTNGIAWHIEPRFKAPGQPPALPAPWSTYHGQGFLGTNPKNPTAVELMAGVLEPSRIAVLMAQWAGLPTPAPEPWAARYEGPIIG